MIYIAKEKIIPFDDYAEQLQLNPSHILMPLINKTNSCNNSPLSNRNQKFSPSKKIKQITNKK